MITRLWNKVADGAVLLVLAVAVVAPVVALAVATFGSGHPFVLALVIGAVAALVIFVGSRSS